MKLCPRLGVFDSPAWCRRITQRLTQTTTKSFLSLYLLRCHTVHKIPQEHTRQTCMCSTATHPHTVLQIRTGGVCFELLSQEDKNRLSKAAPLNIHRRILRNSGRCCRVVPVHCSSVSEKLPSGRGGLHYK